MTSKVPKENKRSLGLFGFMVPYLLCALPFCVLFYFSFEMNPLSFLPLHKHAQEPNRTNGKIYLVTCHNFWPELSCFCWIKLFFTGKVVDHFKCYKIPVFVCLNLVLFHFVSYIFGWYFASIKTIFVFNTFLGLAFSTAHSPVLDMLLQHTYPRNPGLTM